MKLDWNRCVPLGMEGKKVRNWFTMALGVGMGYSVRFLFRLMNAWSELYVWQEGRRVPVRLSLSGGPQHLHHAPSAQPVGAVAAVPDSAGLDGPGLWSGGSGADGIVRSVLSCGEALGGSYAGN